MRLYREVLLYSSTNSGKKTSHPCKITDQIVGYVRWTWDNIIIKFQIIPKKRDMSSVADSARSSAEIEQFEPDTVETEWEDKVAFIRVVPGEFWWSCPRFDGNVSDKQF